MGPKIKPDNSVTPRINRRSKNFTDLQTKIKIIEQSEEGARTSDITKKFNLPWSTVDSILKNKDRYKTAAKSVPGNVKLLKSRADIFIQMEKHLVTWIHERGKCGDSMNSAVIREKAKKLFEKLKEKNAESKLQFVASMGWFNRFLNRTGLKCVLMRGETYSGDAETGNKFGLQIAEEVEDLLQSHNENVTACDTLKTGNREVSEDPELDELNDVPQKDLTAADLKQLFTYIDSIKTITDKDPLQDRAFKCYSAIQSACLPYRTKLKEIEAKTKETRTDRVAKSQRVTSPVASVIRTLCQIPSRPSDARQSSACNMASTIKLESKSDTEFDPLSTQNESELLDIKQEEFVVPVTVTDNEYITSDIKPKPESDSDDSEPLPALGHGELLETILSEDPAIMTTDVPERIGVHVCKHDQHETSRSSKQIHLCAYCGKSFNRKQHLRDHTRMHTQERPYTCDLCKKSFSRKGYLKIHLRLHSGQRPFSCRICNKSFNAKSQLESHVYEHTREGPYLCNICHKAFSDRINLILHQGEHSTH